MSRTSLEASKAGSQWLVVSQFEVARFKRIPVARIMAWREGVQGHVAFPQPCSCTNNKEQVLFTTMHPMIK